MLGSSRKKKFSADLREDNMDVAGITILSRSRYARDRTLLMEYEQRKQHRTNENQKDR